MKRILYLSLALFLIFSVSVNDLIAQSAERVSGSFTKIKAIGKVKIKLIADNENYALVMGSDEENINVSITFVDKGLKVQALKFWKGDYINVDVHYKSLDEINLSAGAQAYASSRIGSKNLEISASEGSDFDAEVECDLLTLKAGQGSRITLSGTADNLNATTNTGAIIDGTNSFANNCTLNANTGSVIEIKGCDTMQAKANTGAEITYNLKPESLKVKESLGGTVSLKR